MVGGISEIIQKSLGLKANDDNEMHRQKVSENLTIAVSEIKSPVPCIKNSIYSGSYIGKDPRKEILELYECLHTARVMGMSYVQKARESLGEIKHLFDEQVYDGFNERLCALQNNLIRNDMAYLDTLNIEASRLPDSLQPLLFYPINPYEEVHRLCALSEKYANESITIKDKIIQKS